MSVRLSKRLFHIADMVTDGNILADVGTDHGYLPVALVLEGRIPSAIAMDIGAGPLARAKEHIDEAGLSDKITTRLSDGLEALSPGEAESIVIAGMGGSLIIRILENAAGSLCGVKELILSPQSEIADVRRFLVMRGYTIDREDFIEDQGKYYPIFHVLLKSDTRTWDEVEYRYGKDLLARGSNELSSYLEDSLEQKKAICERLKSSLREQKTDANRIEARFMQVQEDIDCIEKACARLQSK